MDKAGNWHVASANKSALFSLVFPCAGLVGAQGAHKSPERAEGAQRFFLVFFGLWPFPARDVQADEEQGTLECITWWADGPVGAR